MSTIMEPTVDQLRCDDLLWSAASVETSLASLRAEQFEYLHDFLLAYASDTHVVALAGREQMVRYGGSSTPEIPEFAVAQVQAEMRLSTWAAQRLVADAMSLLYRLPRVFAALEDGSVCQWRARMAASATRDLSPTQVAAVDARLASGHPQGDPLLARMGRKRLSEVIEQVVAVADEQVEDEIAAALADRDISIRPGARGTCDLTGSLSTADGARLWQRLGQVVEWLVELGDDRPKHVLRSVALGMLADPGTVDRLCARVQASRSGQNTDSTGPDSTAEPNGAGGSGDFAARAVVGAAGPLPATVLYVHLDRDSQTWTLDGSGPLTQSQADDLVGHSAVTIRPVIDLAENLSYTGYVAPPRLEEQLRLLNAGKCTFPWCDQPAWTGDYDHLVNYSPNAPPGTPGHTDTRNGHRPCRFHHRVKTHDGWVVESPALGTWLWHGPRGDAYFVTAGTTTRLHR